MPATGASVEGKPEFCYYVAPQRPLFKAEIHNMFLDQSTDLDGRQLYRLTQVVDFPEFVKTASAADISGYDQVDLTHFADMKRRQYPMHTAAATLVSSAFFYDQKGAYNQKEAAWIENRLNERAVFHNIVGAVNKVREKIASFNAAPSDDQLPDDAFGLVTIKANGEKVRKYPIRNIPEVKEAAQYYVKYRDSMPFDVRQLFANKVLDKAASFGLKLEQEEMLTKAAGRGACAAKDAAQLILDRVIASRRPGPGAVGPVQAEMLKLAQVCCTKPSQVRTPEGLAKIASVVDQFDKAYGLHRYYDAGFDRPEDVLFAVTKEAMSELVRDNVETATGNLYKLADLEKLRVAQVRDYMGDEYAEPVTSDGIHVDAEKLASIVKTMPRPDARLFDTLCKDNGIEPWGESKAASEVKLSRAELQELAKARD